MWLLISIRVVVSFSLYLVILENIGEICFLNCHAVGCRYVYARFLFHWSLFINFICIHLIRCLHRVGRLISVTSGWCDSEGRWSLLRLILWETLHIERQPLHTSVSGAETEVVIGNKRCVFLDFKPIWNCFIWNCSLFLAYNFSFLWNGWSEPIMVIMYHRARLWVETFTICSHSLTILMLYCSNLIHEHSWWVGCIIWATSLFNQSWILTRC